MISTEMFYNTSSDSEEEDEEGLNSHQQLILRRRNLRHNSNPFDLPESKFKQYFRLSKEAFKYLLEEVDTKTTIRLRSSSIPTILRLAVTLRILAEGSYQHGAGNDFNLGLAQPTVSKFFKEMVDIIEANVCPKWIQFQMTEPEKSEAKLCFFNKTGFPGVIGCVDGTHIRIFTPKKDEQHFYYNRKGFYSLNAMIVCDHKMRIRYVDARHPGASYDALVWNSSEIKGDAGYPLEPFLITPYRATQEGSPESYFNTKHASTRNIVERTIGVLKNRFRCLLSARQLHYNPKKGTQIVNVCSALHNVCIYYGHEVDYLSEEMNFSDDINVENNILDNEYDNTPGTRVRNQIMNAIIN